MPEQTQPLPRPVAAPVPAAPLKTSRFKVPGEGSSVAISVATIVALLVLCTWSRP